LLNGLIVLVVSALSLASPLILAALGGIVSERSGIMNIALEGKMLVAACLTALVGTATHSAWLGLGAGLLGSVLLSVLHWWLSVGFQIDQVVSGMGINALALGATSFLDKRFGELTSSEMPQLGKWGLHLGPATLFVSVYFVLAYAAPFLLNSWLGRTRPGLRLLATGNAPEKARLAGLDTSRIRLRALILTGLLAGLAGVLIVDNPGRFTDGMTAGRGFIALAAVIIGGWRPLPTMVACLAFGAFDSLQIALQGTSVMGVTIPPQFWQSLSYVAAVVVLAGFLRQTRPPHGLGQL
jgi:simple sugar transport system permease protein